MSLHDWDNIEPELERMVSDDIAGRKREAIGRTRRRLDGKTLPVFDLGALDGPPPPPREWIVPDFMPAREITLFTGPGGSGKSLAAQQLASCLASGLPFLGKHVSPRKVLYLTAEDDENELHRRQRNIMERIGHVPVCGKLFLSSVRGMASNELVTFDHHGEMAHSETFTLLHDTLAMTKAEVLVLDNVAHLFAGNENDRGQVTRFVNALYGLVKQFDLSILLIGHPNKSGDAYSGSTAWLNAVRSQIELARPDDAEHDPDARVLRLGKANYARAGAEIRFRWHDHAFALDDELPRNVMDEIREVGRMNAEDTAFMDCLSASTDRKQAVSQNPGVNYYGKIFPAMREARGLKKEAFEAAFQRLLARREIELDRQLWQRENRAWKYGIRAVDKAADKCTDPLHQTAAPTPPQVIEKPCTDPHAPTPLYTTYIPGAGPDGPPAPVKDGEAGQ